VSHYIASDWQAAVKAQGQWEDAVPLALA
jgi:hypothetical protein